MTYRWRVFMASLDPTATAQRGRPATCIGESSLIAVAGSSLCSMFGCVPCPQIPVYPIRSI